MNNKSIAKYYIAPVLDEVVVDSLISMVWDSSDPEGGPNDPSASTFSAPTTYKTLSPIQTSSPTEQNSSPLGGDLPSY